MIHMAEKSPWLRFVLPALILAAAIVIAILLVVLRGRPPRTAGVQQRPLVQTLEVHPDTHDLTISAYGAVTPAREVAIIPQVGGQIAWVNHDFAPGGIVHRNELLFVIDSSDYVVAAEESRAALEQARARMKQEKGQQKIARREWELFAEEIDTAATDTSLALRQPQLESARAAVSAAHARQQRALLSLSRTRVRAPFNGFIRNENADVGQLVGAQNRVGTIVGTNRYRVQVALQEEKIPWLDIPGVTADSGSPVRIVHQAGSHVIERFGRVEKLLGDVAPGGRMAQVLATIDDPLGLRDPGDTVNFYLPLLVNTYVEVFLQGPRRADLFALPRSSLRNGDQVYLYASDSTLVMRKPSIAWRSENNVYIEDGLAPGDLVITSALTAPVEGMKLRRAPHGGPARITHEGGGNE
ncbi:MAG: efflux RND transporter periplasmic adaptor subunit [Chitinivibrionales bacterium]|nr:efflux RND transporter periplasmic adaptor subunit [Chitinivibrionales bacterium]